MPPKTPKELKEQAEKQNEDRPADGHSRTAEGLKVPNPSRDDFFGNLSKASKSDPPSD
jgi:hypothetical protein